MKKAIIGIVDSRSQAEAVVETLQRTAGIAVSDISVLLPDVQGTKDFAHEHHTKAPEGAATGAAVGGLTGALVGLGIPEIEAKAYEGKIRGGNVLIAVHTEDRETQRAAEEILKNAGAHHVAATNEANVPKDARV